MADTKTTDLTALTGANTAPTDVIPIVDISDITQGASGTTKKQTRQEFQTYNAGTLTTDVKVLDLSATWNAGAVTFTGLKFNATNTASATGSVLQDWQLNGTPQISIKTLTSSIAALYIGSSYLQASGGVLWNVSGNRGALSSTGVDLVPTSTISWTSSANDPAGAKDSSIARIAAGIIGVRDGSTGGAAISMIEQTAPAAPAANGVYIYAQDNGAGKTQLMALFATGVAQQIAIEP